MLMTKNVIEEKRCEGYFHYQTLKQRNKKLVSKETVVRSQWVSEPFNTK